MIRWQLIFPNLIMKKKQKKSKDPDGEPTIHFSGLDDLQRKELTGDDGNDSTEVTDTDEDEDEGTGDGNIGRKKDDPFGK